MAKRGGHREGSGRKKGIATIEREKAKDYIAERIGEYMPAIFNVLIKKAVTGDIQAIKELFDRGFGKPAQAVDLSNKDGTLKNVIVQKYGGNGNDKPAT